MKRSMEKAVELGPKVEKLSAEAAQLLRDRKSAEALPKQQEALKLLKEIAEPLAQAESQAGSESNKTRTSRIRIASRIKKQQDQKTTGPEAGSEATAARATRKQQAEAAIRQVQERQQKRQEMEKQLQQYMSRPGKVDKDW